MIPGPYEAVRKVNGAPVEVLRFIPIDGGGSWGWPIRARDTHSTPARRAAA